MRFRALPRALTATRLNRNRHHRTSLAPQARPLVDARVNAAEALMSLHRLAIIAMAMNGERAYACQRAGGGGGSPLDALVGVPPATSAIGAR